MGLITGSISQLLFPLTCLICKQPGEILCRSCDRKFARVKRNSYLGEISIWPGALYCDDLANIIVAAKDMNSSTSRNFLVQLLVEAFMRATAELNRDSRITLIPIPSSSSANRRRGFRHAALLSNALAKRVRGSFEEPVRTIELLRLNRKVADQSALNKSQRIQNLSGAYSVIPRYSQKLRGELAGATFLIDDLLTSGITAQEGVRALKVAGITLNGVLCAGVSPRLFS